jgi:hypothetical protein
MANRQFTQFRYSLEKKIVDLFADVTFGSSGAPTLVKAKSKGVKSITRTSAGLYVITLQDSYKRLLMMKAIFINATAPASPAAFIVSTTVGSVNPPAITVTFNSAGVATDPASGEEVLLQIVLSDSDAI